MLKPKNNQHKKRLEQEKKQSSVITQIPNYIFSTILAGQGNKKLLNIVPVSKELILLEEQDTNTLCHLNNNPNKTYRDEEANSWMAVGTVDEKSSQPRLILSWALKVELQQAEIEKRMSRGQKMTENILVQH